MTADALSVFNGRLRYDQRPVVGLGDVADDEPASVCPSSTGEPSPKVLGFVVGHHFGMVSLDVDRRLRRELCPDDAYQLGLSLMWAADLARPETL